MNDINLRFEAKLTFTRSNSLLIEAIHVKLRELNKIKHLTGTHKVIAMHSSVSEKGDNKNIDSSRIEPNSII